MECCSTVQNEVGAEFLKLYDCFYGSIYGYCAYRLFSKDVAEDATAEVFVRLTKKYSLLRGGNQSDLTKWLYGTASNVVAGYLRDARHRRKIAEDLASRKDIGVQNPEDQDRLDWPRLYEAIGKLSSRSQEIIALRYFRGMEGQEIAEMLGMSHGAVRVRLSRAIGKLRQELGKSFGEFYETT
jgi:RNA polymerase sigma-70 factor (ECF subfamily)